MSDFARERLKKRKQKIEKALDAYYEAEIAIVGGAQSYSVGVFWSCYGI